MMDSGFSIGHQYLSFYRACKLLLYILLLCTTSLQHLNIQLSCNYYHNLRNDGFRVQYWTSISQLLQSLQTSLIFTIVMTSLQHLNIQLSCNYYHNLRNDGFRVQYWTSGLLLLCIGHQYLSFYRACKLLLYLLLLCTTSLQHLNIQLSCNYYHNLRNDGFRVQYWTSISQLLQSLQTSLIFTIVMHCYSATFKHSAANYHNLLYLLLLCTTSLQHLNIQLSCNYYHNLRNDGFRVQYWTSISQLLQSLQTSLIFTIVMHYQSATFKHSAQLQLLPQSQK